MNDPDRIADGGADDPEADLLRAARRYRISDETRKRAFAVAGLSAGSAVLAARDAAAKGVAAGSKSSAISRGEIPHALSLLDAYGRDFAQLLGTSHPRGACALFGAERA